MSAANKRLYVPEFPTLYPGMLFSRGIPADAPPFESDNVHWFYFARNAVWNAVKMLGLEGREVLVPSYHHGVEVEALVHAGAKPVFYRVGRSWDVDLADVAARIGPDTGALYLIHYAGFPGPAREMKSLAEKHGLALIEDCALSLLSSDRELKLGTIGDVGIFCLYKTLPVPNGGALQVNGAHRYKVARLQSPPTVSVFNHTASALLKNLELRGGRTGRWSRSLLRSLAHGAVRASQVERIATGTMHFDPGHVNLGISPLSLRIVRAHDFADTIARRRHNYMVLLEQLAPVCPPLFESLADGVCPLFYPLRVKHKDKVLQRLQSNGIGAVDFWRDPHPACDSRSFPESTELRNSIIEIPCHQDISAETTSRMVAVVHHAVCGS
ncbi:MAG: aminotransferase DegT [Lysobacterales bacterium]|nr:MAG: aminotransferase DegT [Xanthomonadales bacterium]